MSPEIEARTIAGQNLLPAEGKQSTQILFGNHFDVDVVLNNYLSFINFCLCVGEMKYHGIGGEYLRPRTINRYRIIKNKGQFFNRPSRTQGLLNGKENVIK